MGSKSIGILILSLSGILFAGSAFNYFFSSQDQQQKTRPIEISSALEISLPDTALPVVALDEIHLTLEDPLENLFWSFPENAEMLESGEAFVFEKKEVIELPALQVVSHVSSASADLPNEKNRVHQETPEEVPEDVRKEVRKEVRIIPNISKRVIRVSQAKPSSPQANNVIESSSFDWDRLATLLIPSKKSPGGETRNQEKNKDSNESSFSQNQSAASIVSAIFARPEKTLLAEKIDAESSQGEQNQQAVSEKRIKVASGGEIIVRAGSPTSGGEEKKNADSANEKRKVATVDSVVSKVAASPMVQTGPAFVKGHLEMAGGLGYSGTGEEILIYRESEGAFWDEGKIWLRQGLYEISVSDLQGILVAQLKDKDGFLVGEGVFDLSRLAQQSRSLVAGQVVYENIDMTIRPVVKGITGKVISAYSFDNVDVPVKEPMVLSSVFDDLLPVNDEGDFFVEHVVQKSRFQLKATARDHWGTIVAGRAGVHQKIQLFPNKMVQAMVELSLGANHPVVEDYGIVWGRVVQNGKPVAGAKVELIGEGMRPIYFQSMIPDPSLRSTSENGLFAFIGVSPGLQQVQAHHEGRWLKPVSFSADSRHISNVTIEKVPTHQVPVRIFDAFDTGKPLPGVVRIIGDENLHEVSSAGLGKIEVPLDHQLMFVEATSFSNYESVRLLTTRSEKHIHLPMVSTGWIESLAHEKNISANKDLGTVIGFTNGASGFRAFEVFLGSDRLTEQNPILYFDADGRIVDRGVSGGGFIIFNVAKGLQTVVVNPNAPYDVASRMIYSEPGVVSLFQQTYR